MFKWSASDVGKALWMQTFIPKDIKYYFPYNDSLNHQFHSVVVHVCATLLVVRGYVEMLISNFCLQQRFWLVKNVWW